MQNNPHRHLIATLIIICWGLIPLAPTCYEVPPSYLVAEPTPTLCPSGSFYLASDPAIAYTLSTRLGRVSGTIEAPQDHLCRYDLVGDSDGPGDSITWTARLSSEEVQPGSEDPSTCCTEVEFTGTVFDEDCNRIDGTATSQCPGSGEKVRQMTIVRE